jgi:hypothetical protein
MTPTVGAVAEATAVEVVVVVSEAEAALAVVHSGDVVDLTGIDCRNTCYCRSMV